MGIKSTYDIERSTALAVILSKLHECSNEQLANMLEQFDESYFRNYNVYDNLPDDNFDRVIKNVREF